MINKFIILFIWIIFSGCIDEINQISYNLYNTSILEMFREVDETEIEKLIIDEINRIRIENNLHPYLHNAKLSYIARNYSYRMNNERFFNHIDPQGKGPSSRLLHNRYFHFSAGENLFYAKGRRCDRGVAMIVVDGWMNSIGHRALILHEDLTEVGIGVFCKDNTLYATMLASTRCTKMDVDYKSEYSYLSTGYDLDYNTSFKLNITINKTDCEAVNVRILGTNSSVSKIKRYAEATVYDSIELIVTADTSNKCRTTLEICLYDE